MLDARPIVCPDCRERRLRKLPGRPNVDADERWVCQGAIEELNKKGPRVHRGVTWNVSYLMRSPEHAAALSEAVADVNSRVAVLKAEGKIKEAAELLYLLNDRVTAAEPGDVIVDRDFRTVYLIDERGARRRCDDYEAKQVAIDAVKEKLKEAKK